MSPVPSPTSRDRVFVSHSHADAEWLNLLRSRLAPEIRSNRIDYFDGRLHAGSLWHEQIRTAIAGARVAVLLASPRFFASEYIQKEKLPPTLLAAERSIPIRSRQSTIWRAYITARDATGRPSLFFGTHLKAPAKSWDQITL
jgi:hypothetical protein